MERECGEREREERELKELKDQMIICEYMLGDIMLGAHEVHCTMNEEFTFKILLAVVSGVCVCVCMGDCDSSG